jgi:hypothetical protein
MTRLKFRTRALNQAGFKNYAMKYKIDFEKIIFSTWKL